jgi:Zn-dependent protease with chaperone function
MDPHLYPPSPAGVTPDLVRPSRAFKLQAWAAVVGLMLFLAVYFGLAAWFGWVAYQSIQELVHEPAVWFLSAFKAFIGLFFFALMVKGVFFVRRTARKDLVEVTEGEQPALHAFVRQVAKEAGASRPHKVFLSNRVNAAVFYDISLWNVLFPSRKNLEVGVGLVNALSLDEFKAVVAHEFGHFAQRTMSVGSWVYISQAFVGTLVARRDIFDRFLEGISRIDLRVAWIGWGMRLLVWSLRAVFDTFFRGLILLERALSRQMEFQADLVSVSLTGSDSLVHALHKLGAADDAWDRAVGFSKGETYQGRRVADVFAVQTRVIERMAVIYDDPKHGRTPELPPAREGHRLFSSQLADVPRMWSSHPPNHEREENAKRRYFPSAFDPRPAWVLFRYPETLRAKMTETLLREDFDGKQFPEAAVPIEETIAKLDEGFARPRLDPRFRGAFLREPLVRHAANWPELYEVEHPRDLWAALAALYPPALSQLLDRCEELADEKALLEGLKDGFLVAPGGVIRFRGRELRRKELAKIIADVSKELGEVRAQIEAHDRAARTAYRSAAGHLGRGWPEHLAGLLAVAHYAEHAAANLADASAYVQHVVNVITADGRVSSGEMERLMAAARDAHGALYDILRARNEVRLPAPMRQKLDVDDWGEMLPDPELVAPAAEFFGQGWLGDLDNVADGVCGRLTRLRNVALDCLVEAEAHVERCLRGQLDPGEAPAPGRVPEKFRRLKPGGERERQKRLGWWDRFITADGFFPGALRLAVASAILVPFLALALTTAAGRKVAVHNGLGVWVEVDVGGEHETLAPHASRLVEIHPGWVEVVAKTRDGVEIERFRESVPRYSDVVYNIAGASTLVDFTMVYGGGESPAPRVLGAGRWMTETADYYFTDAPSSISGKGTQVRHVLQAIDSEPPEVQLGNASSDDERAAMMIAHAKFDPPPQAARWSQLAPPELTAIDEALATRPIDVAVARVRMDRATPATRAEQCQGHAENAQAKPGDADAAYLAARCLEGRAADDAMLAGWNAHPGHPWFRAAAGLVLLSRGEWDKGVRQLEELLRDPRALEVVGADVTANAIARGRRMVASSPAYDDLVAHDARLAASLAIERGEADASSSSFVQAAVHLAKGELEDTMATRMLTPEHRTSFRRLVAASEGVSEAVRDPGFALEATEGIDWRTAWPTVALYVREGRDPAPIVGALPDFLRDDGVLTALQSPELRKNPALLDRAVDGMDIRLRGAARVAGIVLLGKKAPPAWRQEAHGLLFASERPYLAP